EQRAAQLAREVACADRLAREAEEKLLAVEIRVRRCALLQLEDQFTCPLCFDIISAPYVLNGATCGHTFCASCILKWYLARMHDCGSWHENVVCPMCRSALIHTPDLGDNPRSIFYCPFTPNRVADTAIKTLVRKVATSGTLSTPGHEPTSVADTPTKRRRGKVSAKGVFESAVAGTDPGDPLLSWMDSQGANLVEWRRRGEEGQAAMDRLRTNWHRLDNADFVLMKETMGLCVRHDFLVQQDQT
ncbi:hypothetical protein PUNSTDRAFT_65972, partial [Punctularia strigosozonata HHB-11173 SS5]|uniref:uncharacterized protein n=1 Tax=Punctularia strigosozonata (strain HHB-11173) TaxID=741275 RepID=UPI0004416F49